jgi:acyl carrier protein
MIWIAEDIYWRTPMSDTRQRVIKVVCQVLKTPPAQVSDNARFVEDLGAESIQSVELVAAFEEEFDIEMDEEAALAVRDVGKAVEFIDKVRMS